MASVLALQCSSNWAMKTRMLEAEQFIKFIITRESLNMIWVFIAQLVQLFSWTPKVTPVCFSGESKHRFDIHWSMWYWNVSTWAYFRIWHKVLVYFFSSGILDSSLLCFKASLMANIDLHRDSRARCLLNEQNGKAHGMEFREIFPAVNEQQWFQQWLQHRRNNSWFLGFRSKRARKTFELTNGMQTVAGMQGEALINLGEDVRCSFEGGGGGGGADGLGAYSIFTSRSQISSQFFINICTC